MSDLPEPKLEEAIAHIHRVRPVGLIALTAIPPDGGPTHTATFAPGEDDKALRWLEEHSAAGRNLYWTVNPTRERITSKAKKADIENLDWLHVDIDPADDADPVEAREVALALLRDYKPKHQPTLTLDSGGGVQAFWQIEEPGLFVGCNEAAAEEAECYTRQIEIDLARLIQDDLERRREEDPGAGPLIKVDSCHDCCRVMRLPGTINQPGEKKRETGRVPRLASVIERHDDTDHIYGLGEFTAAPLKNVAPTTGQATVQLDGVPPPLDSLDELPAAVSQRTRMLIVQGCDPDEPDKYASRSEVTFAVACGMVRGGCDDQTIAAVLLDPDMGISAHTLAQKRALDYAARQITKAREAVAKDSFGPGGRRVLNPHAPYEIAERLKAELLPTAIHTNDDWLEYDSGAYRDVEDATVRSTLYRELNDALVSKVTDGEVEYLPFNPDTGKVNKVLDALEGVAHQPADRMAPPVWLEGSGPSPLDIVACRNGLLDVPKGELLDPTPRFFTRNALDLDFDPNAPEPQEWLAFVRQVFPDPTAAELLQDWFGYLLLPDTSQEKMLIMIGPPRSGKGTIQKVLTELVGRSNVCAPSVKALGGQFGLEPLIGKTVAFLSDIRLGGQADADAIAETLLKISGRDDVTADRKHKKAWTGRLSTRFVISSNVLPKLADASPALANRFSPLRMQESFLGREDHGLADRLLAELPGILLWALGGRRRLRDRGRFALPGTSEDAVQELLQLGSDVAAFVQDRCEVSAGNEIEKEGLYGFYRDWCERTGRKPKHSSTFGQELFAATSNRVSPRRLSRGGERINVYAGIGLRTGTTLPEENEPY